LRCCRIIFLEREPKPKQQREVRSRELSTLAVFHHLPEQLQFVRSHLSIGILHGAFADGRRRALRARSPIRRPRNPLNLTRATVALAFRAPVPHLWQRVNRITLAAGVFRSTCNVPQTTYVFFKAV
jgi:hypothetical protein